MAAPHGPPSGWLSTSTRHGLALWRATGQDRPQGCEEPSREWTDRYTGGPERLLPCRRERRRQVPQGGVGNLLERSPRAGDGPATAHAQRAALRAFGDVAEALGEV